MSNALDKSVHATASITVPAAAGSHLTAAETAALKKEIVPMWKYELVHLYSITVESACQEKDLGKQHRILQRAEIMSDEILNRMRR